jgi:hypothetical protein
MLHGFDVGCGIREQLFDEVLNSDAAGGGWSRGLV